MTFDVLILGAGPAGLAAARAAAGAGRVALVDDNPAAGGQIWRGAPQIDVPAGVTFLPQTRVFDLRPGFVADTVPHGPLHAKTIILATGARELFLPFPGWTEPGVLGAGGLQAFVKSGLPVAGKRIVVAGTGPLLIAVAASLRARGARIAAVVEQAPLARILPFLLRYPAKLPQAIALRARLAGVPYWTGVWPVRFEAGRVTLSNGRELPVDYLACGFGLVPNTEAAARLGCRIDDGFVAVDTHQQTTVPGVYCAGEPTGIGGLEKALDEGTRAGLAATGRPHAPRRVDPFVVDLARAFALDPRLKTLAAPDTIVCRCEQVPLDAVQSFTEWRDAKLQTRCGMGACQGRVCGPIVENLFGWTPASVRPPILPVPAAALATARTRPAPESDRSDTGRSANP